MKPINHKTQVSLADAINYFKAGHFSLFTLQSSRYAVSNHLSPNQAKPSERIIKPYHGKEFLIYGIPMTQFDLAVNLALLKLMKIKQSRVVIQFTLAELVRALNRPDGSRIRESILASLKKHESLYVDIDHGNYANFHGNKIQQIQEEVQNHFKLIWNERFVLECCYAAETCQFNFDKFLNLSLGLQSWLYGFFCSEPNLNAIDIDTLHALSGSHYRNQQDFKKAVKVVLGELYKNHIIRWRHGVTREGIVFWENNQLLQ